jgi:hypothetical protein
VWDEAQSSFDISLRFTDSDNVDRTLHPKGAVSVDLEALLIVIDDNDRYATTLTDSVFVLDEVQTFFNNTIKVAEKKQLHLRLHIDGPEVFHSIRWELLLDPVTRLPIAKSRNVLFSRYLSGGDWRPVVDVPSRDLRALIAIANPSDVASYISQGRRLGSVPVATELRQAQQALARFSPIALSDSGEATLANIMAKLDEGVDILYLVCHGTQTPDVPLLYLEHPDGRTDPVDARRLEEHIRNLSKRPTVVLLNSCQSAGTGDQRYSDDQRLIDDGGALAALGPRLARAGIPAVIAMQSNITVGTASIFGRSFLEAFADEQVVDYAMAEARAALRDQADWWKPVLFSRLRSGRIYYEPQFTERAQSTWEILKTMMEIGNFTPVLGPGLADSLLGSREDIAQRWARRWQMPIASYAHHNLAQVAQYLRVSHNPAMVPGQLQKYLKSEMHERKLNARGSDPFVNVSESAIDNDPPETIIVNVGRDMRLNDAADPFRVVASMPVKVFVTTGWTDLLQAALRDTVTAKQPQTICFPWTSRVIWEHDGWIDPDEATPPTVQTPWVFHLFGRLEVPESLVLTEDDYFDWLSSWTTQKDLKQVVPAAVRSALSGSSLLFLGYHLDDWDFRVVFQSIKGFGMRKRYNDHVGVQLRPESGLIEREAAQRYLESYFGEEKINIFWSDTRTFLDELRLRTGLKP